MASCAAQPGESELSSNVTSGPDLTESAVSDPPATVIEGVGFSVTDTAQNIGDTAAVATVTRYFVSLDGVSVAPGTKQLGNRNVAALGAGAMDTGTASVSVAAGTAQGTYYVLACADKTNLVAETNENNNCHASTNTMSLTAPDLTESGVSATPTQIDSNGTLSISDTVTDNTMTDAGASTTRFLLSVDNVKSADDGFVRNCVNGGITPGRSVPALTAGTSSTGTTDVTPLCVRDATGLHAVTAGTYYVIACADDTQTVAESDETNNCAVSATPIAVTVCGNGILETGEACDDGNTVAGDGCSPTCQIEAAADLTETAVTEPPATASLGGSFAVTDTVSNLSTGPAVATTTRYYLSRDRIKSGGDYAMTGSRAVPALNGMATDSGTVTVTVPAVAAGAYYLIACADATNLIAESNEANNCIASVGTVTLSGPDLIQTAVTDPPTTALNGDSFSVTDTAQNTGADPAGASVTRYFVSLDGVHPAPGTGFLGSRNVAALAAGATDSGTVTVTIPSNIAAGTYRLLACADKTNVVPEVNEANNCFGSTGSVTLSGPDLIESAVSVGAASVPVGSSLTVSDTVTNATSVPTTVSALTRFYVSTDNVKNSTDWLMRSCTNSVVIARTVPPLAGSGTSSGTTTLGMCYRDATGSHPVPAGTYYMIACADDSNVVRESSDTNNCTATATTFTVTP